MDVDVTVDKKGKLTYRIESAQTSNSSLGSSNTLKYLQSIPANVNPAMMSLWGLKATSFSKDVENLKDSNESGTKTSFAEMSTKTTSPKFLNKTPDVQNQIKSSQTSNCRIATSLKLEDNAVKNMKSQNDKGNKTSSMSEMVETPTKKAYEKASIESPKKLTSFASSGRRSKDSTPRSAKSSSRASKIENVQLAQKESKLNEDIGPSRTTNGLSYHSNATVTYKNPAENDWVVRTATLSNGRSVHRVTDDHVSAHSKEEFSQKTLEMCRNDPYLASLLFSKEKTAEKCKPSITSKSMTSLTDATLPVEFKKELSANPDNHHWSKVTNSIGVQAASPKAENREAESESSIEKFTADFEVQVDRSTNFTSDYRTASENSNASKAAASVACSMESGFGDRFTLKSFDGDSNYSNVNTSREGPLTFRPISKKMVHLRESDDYCDENADNERTNFAMSRESDVDFASFRSRQEEADLESKQISPKDDARKSDQRTPKGMKNSKSVRKTPRTPSTSRKVTFRDERSSSESSSSLSDAVYGIPKAVPKYLKKNSTRRDKSRKADEKADVTKGSKPVRPKQPKNSDFKKQTRACAETSDDEFEKFWKVSTEDWKSLSPYQKYLKYKTMTQTQKIGSNHSNRSKFLDSDSDAFLEREKLTEFNPKSKLDKQKEKGETGSVLDGNNQSGKDGRNIEKKSDADNPNEVCDSESEFKFGRNGRKFSDLNSLTEDFLFTQEKPKGGPNSKKEQKSCAENTQSKQPVKMDLYEELQTFRPLESSWMKEEESDKNTDQVFDASHEYRVNKNESCDQLKTDRNTKLGNGSLFLETYRSREDQELSLSFRRDEQKRVSGDSDSDSMVSVSTFMPETLRSISEAFSRNDGTLSKMSLNDTRDNFESFIATDEPIVSVSKTDDLESAENSLGKEKVEIKVENIESQSGSADSLIDKMYEEPQRRLTAVQPIGHRNQYITRGTTDDFQTFKDFVSPEHGNQKESKSSMDKVRKSLGFEDLDQFVADRFGGKSVRDMCSERDAAVSKSMMLESMGIDDDFDQEYFDTIPTGFAVIRSSGQPRLVSDLFRFRCVFFFQYPK